MIEEVLLDILLVVIFRVRHDPQRDLGLFDRAGEDVRKTCI